MPGIRIIMSLMINWSPGEFDISGFVVKHPQLILRPRITFIKIAMIKTTINDESTSADFQG